VAALARWYCAYLARFARPLVLRIAPRPRAALPLAPAERLPVSFANASMTLPAILSRVPSALFRDPDFMAPCPFRCDSAARVLKADALLAVEGAVLVPGPARPVVVDRALRSATAARVQQEEADHKPHHTGDHEDHARSLDREPGHCGIDRKGEDRTHRDQEYRCANRQLA
jgi:hypothetical protein